MQVWPDAVDLGHPSTTSPSKEELLERVSSFVQSLYLTPAKIRAIEQHTKQQSSSPQWFAARRYRLTASLFGEVFRQRDDTAPDALVLRIIQQKQFSSGSIKWGKVNEAVALKEYES